jgi:hypothetical protein
MRLHKAHDVNDLQGHENKKLVVLYKFINVEFVCDNQLNALLWNAQQYYFKL